jgi:hypothetical protein
MGEVIRSCRHTHVILAYMNALSVDSEGHVDSVIDE